jgi:hypothetical protein
MSTSRGDLNCAFHMLLTVNLGDFRYASPKRARSYLLDKSPTMADGSSTHSAVKVFRKNFES